MTEHHPECPVHNAFTTEPCDCESPSPESQPILSGTELKRLLDELSIACRSLGAINEATDTQDEYNARWARSNAAYRALEEYVERKTARIEVLEKRFLDMTIERNEKIAELSRLRSSALTDQNALSIADALISNVSGDQAEHWLDKAQEYVSLRSTYSRESVK